MNRTMKEKKIIVLTSGRGSNFRALIQAIELGKLNATIHALGTSTPGSGAVKIANDAGIPVLIRPSETELTQFVRENSVDAVVLAGYLKILSREFIDALRDARGVSRIVNIHPSLLPAFPGLNSYRQAFEHGVAITGATVHLVEPAVDSGPILDQSSFRIDEMKSTEEVESRGLEVEHSLYASTLNWFMGGEYTIEKRGARIHVARS
ncbi:MAG: phosphoribosylglycinamide formyltransferase [Cryobacterium sp.]|nr:phosphoribosylglycinamide formyltransferase [Oligoflexia bacterium]